jgi:ribosomal protein S18 acetylase RimI-like enzyme
MRATVQVQTPTTEFGVTTAWWLEGVRVGSSRRSEPMTRDAAVSLRPARPSDGEGICALVPRLTAGAPPWRDVMQMVAADTAAVTEAIQTDDADRMVFVAERAGTLLGFIHLMAVTDYYTGRRFGHVADLVVAAEVERQGVGRMLMRLGEQWARDRGFPAMTLNALVNNSRARAAYERLGYQPEWIKYIKPLS